MPTCAGLSLDQPFDPEAYKCIPGADFLTDIDLAYMKKCLNDVFGICGLSWGYAYNPGDMLIEAGSRTDGTGAFLKAGIVWFKLVTNDDQEHTISIQASGGGVNPGDSSGIDFSFSQRSCDLSGARKPVLGLPCDLAGVPTGFIP